MSSGGTTTTNSSGQQQQQPWAPAVPYLTNILGAAGGSNLAPTSAQSAAAQGIFGAANQVPSYGPQASNLTSQLFGYNTKPQQNMLTNAYSTLGSQLSPYLQSNYLNPETNPYLAPSLNALGQQAEQATNSLFAASGRDPAGNAQAAKAGAIAMTNAEAPYLLGQYNTNVGQQQGAINALFGGAGSTSTGLTAQQLEALGVNQGGAQLAEGLPGIYEAAPQGLLTAANTAANIGLVNPAAMEQLINPIAGLGGTMNYYGTQGTTPPSSLASNLLGGGLGLLSLGTPGAAGAAGAGGTIGGNIFASMLPSLMMFSDVKLKEDIQPMGSTDIGLPVYEFRYKGQPQRHIGLMAQDVEKIFPEAVRRHPSGYKMVDYGAATNGLLGGIL